MVRSEVLIAQDHVRNGVAEQSFFTPLVTALILLFFSLIISLIQVFKMSRSRFFRIYDTLLFGVAGLGGVIIFFLMYFITSCYQSELNLVWLNPVALLAALFFWVKSARGSVYIYHFINFVLLTLFLLCWWFLPQQYRWLPYLFP